MLSMFDIFKVGVGPSSSHTNGPMLAAYLFVQQLKPQMAQVSRIRIELYGSLSLTGKGHHTDRACMMGLMGYKPDTIDIGNANQSLDMALQHRHLCLDQIQTIRFDPERDLVFHDTSLDRHENGMAIHAFDDANKSLQQETYYSTGGGFIVSESQWQQAYREPSIGDSVPLPFDSAQTLLEQAKAHQLSIAELVLTNEKTFRSQSHIDQQVNALWQTLQTCIQRGLDTEGVLDGGLNVTRRAPSLYQSLTADEQSQDPLAEMDWISAFAFAVSEENAAGGKVVTSPTNGAAGVIPAVLMYYHQRVKPLEEEQIKAFFAVCGAIGILYKTNASISGAEVGCQGEIGVSSSMAAAGLTALFGGTNDQVCIAAEIAMEHSLGMTCDPMMGLVQVPCIERNGMGAMKAVNAARMAMKRTSSAIVSLDKVIEVMYQTGKDINRKYRETSLGGLALINLCQ
ncbi:MULTISPECIES: L-serine ammonia-lyase [unclassified Vibrio]|uniref:L-serine dehydratase n=1 Tax=Vibrio sp. HB236076 TaxID=3232307 RepID=A0AB39HCD5_9VIBR|nr:L-serine ammonia-lyase [Vibrio sp. HB161653]MDP5253453.1 L-serine ammonia-lyase [Vibrio sp. HB161653]